MLSSREAKLCRPMAIALDPAAEAPKPMAVPYEPEAWLFVPTAVVSIPLATAPSPQAKALVRPESFPAPCTIGCAANAPACPTTEGDPDGSPNVEGTTRLIDPRAMDATIPVPDGTNATLPPEVAPATPHTTACAELAPSTSVEANATAAQSQFGGRPPAPLSNARTDCPPRFLRGLQYFYGTLER